ncbi:MAG: type I methionyl aminopeptidase [Chloroflexi bacterium]|jgi:methionyl aminopeptidase|nr:type I methionyl aminopeptidase [Chloroflexota bacterium]
MAVAIKTKTPDEIERMRRAGHIVAAALEALRAQVRPGITTQELDAVADEVIRSMGGTPSFKGYRGYPASICASINEEIVHGIPGPRQLQEGDVISLDVGAIYEGYQGDAAITVAAGKVSSQVQRLMEATQAALAAGINAARDGGRLGDVSYAIEAAAQSAGFQVIREYGGHGIGQHMHEQPMIPNWGHPGRGYRLKAGMTLAIEPMLVLGSPVTQVRPDGWTVVTADRSVSAHFEHTIAITEDGAEILTKPSAI